MLILGNDIGCTPADSHGYGLASLLTNPELSIAKSARQVMTVIPIHEGYTITTLCLDLIANNLSIGSQVQY